MVVNKDLQTEGIVLKRINYGEADRILTLITPSGKISAIAKGVRKARSRLAGGVEMFTRSVINLHEGKGDLYVLTGAKMIEHFGGIVKDLERVEAAGEMLKEVSRRAEGEGAEFFEVLLQALREVDGGSVALARAWFRINMVNLTEGVNLFRDVSGAKLDAEGRYEWDAVEKAFRAREGGRFGVDEIKMLRLLVSSRLEVAKKVRAPEGVLERVFEFTERCI